MFHKGEHERCFAYTEHTACDRHNFIFGIKLSPANVHDRVMFKSIYGKMKTSFPDIKYVVADADYKIPYSSTNWDGYREYKSYQKTVIRHVWADYLDIAEDFRYTPRGKAIYRECLKTIERVFADAKEKHGLRYTTFRGNAKVTMQALLTFAFMNLKKLAIWKSIYPRFRPESGFSMLFLLKFILHSNISAKSGAWYLAPNAALSTI